MNLRLTTSAAATRYWQIAAVLYLFAGVAATWVFSPRVPYADQWNHYAHLLQRPFWTGVFSADNGHAEVLPNLLRLLELRLGSPEILQIAAGMLLAALSVWVLLDLVLRDSDLTPPARAASAFAVVFGIYWLGNTRALTQEHDAVHVYTVVLCLSLALRFCLTSRTAKDVSRGELFGAIALCVFASFSFGSGIASFAALAAMSCVQRMRPALLLVVCGAALGTVLLYRVLPGAVVDRASYDLGLDTLTLALRLLGSPFVYLFWPLVDPAAAAAAPMPLREVFVPIADAWTAHFGDIHRSLFPQAAMGLAALALILWNTWVIWRRGASRSASVGIAVAWFGLGVAGLIAITRTGYFALHPDQIYAPRYLPWLSLCWCGLLLASVARTRISRTALVIALVLPLLALPSEIGMGLLGRRMQNVAEDIALAGAVGVFPLDFALGETDIDDLRVVLPLLHEARTAMFAWPEAQLLGKTLPSSATPLGATDIQTLVAVDRIGGVSGTEVDASVASTCNQKRVMAVEDDRVIGLLRRQPDGHWRGVAVGAPTADKIKFAALCE